MMIMMNMSPLLESPELQVVKAVSNSLAKVKRAMGQPESCLSS
jgi:hypothetical protein